MRRAMRGAVAALWAAGAAGCGGLLGGDSSGDPMVLLDGTLHTESEALVVQKPERLRAALVWHLYPDETVECVEAGTFDCLNTKSPSFQTYVEDVPVTGAFPGVFQMPLYAAPDPASLHHWKGATFGMASVLAYEDRNDNHRLDPVAPEDLSSIDNVLGSNGDLKREVQRTLVDIVYREGDLHPLWRSVAFIDCPEPPQGYSVVKQYFKWDEASRVYVFERCQLFSGQVPVPMWLPETGAGQLACAADISVWYYPNWQPAPATPPDPATTTSQCAQTRRRGQTVLEVNLHPERFCQSANTVFYSLASPTRGGWNQTASPPEWWPCPVTPVP